MSLPKIDMPTFKVTIPSTNQEVTMRLMRVKDEKVLLMAKEGGEPGEILTAVKQVVQNCLVTPQIDLDNWAIFDVEYVFLRLRAQSVSDTTEVAYIDNDEVSNPPKSAESITSTEVLQAKATYRFTIDLNKVEVKFPEKLEKTIKLNDKSGIVLRYPPASLYSDKEFMNAGGENLVDMLIQKSIETIYDGKNVTNVSIKKPDDLKEWIDNLDIKVYNKIRDFFVNIPHLFYEIKYTNKNGKDRVIALTTLQDFFTLA